MEMTILFYVFAVLTVVSAFAVVFARSLIYSAFSLLFTFMGVAGLYVLLSADFIAVAQIMVYIGGILILLVFGVMLTRHVTDVEIRSSTIRTLPATVVVGLASALSLSSSLAPSGCRCRPSPTSKARPWNSGNCC